MRIRPLGSIAIVVLLGVGVAACGTSTPAKSPAKPVTPITFTIASATNTYLNLDFAVAQAAGFTKAQGISLTVLPLGSNEAATGAVLNGSAQFAVGVPSYQIPIVAQHQPLNMVNFFEYTYPFKWSVAVLNNSPYHSLAQLAGKTIGVQSFGVSDYTVGQKLFKLAGVNPTSGIHWVATGDLAPAAHALATGEVAAMVTYDTTEGSWTALHEVNYRNLPLPKGVPEVGGLFLSTTPAFLRAHRNLAIAFGRAVAEANIFAIANPLEAAKMFYQVYPSALPPGTSAAVAAQEVVAITARRRQEYLPYFKGKIGYTEPSEWVSEVEFAGYSPSVVNPTQFYTNSLIPTIDNFSASHIQSLARTWGEKKS